MSKMGSKLYEVYDTGGKIASDMTLTTALLLIRTYCETYHQEYIDLRLVEMEKES